MPCHLFLAYLIEVAAVLQTKGAIGRTKKQESPRHIEHQLGPEKQTFRSSWHLIAFAHSVNATLNLVIASYVVYLHIHHPGIGTLCELHAVLVWLKTCSYALTNRDLRHSWLSASASPLPDLYATCPYPRNITISNLSYFWWAPTLVYQPVYPRTSSIRWNFVAARLTEVVCLSIAIWIASAQYAVPLLRNSLPIVSTLDFPSILERLMKLSSISLFCWLAGFFALFQSALNALAEVMRFADREFYLDWWNSSSIKTYWSSWNRPVYQFMKRHIYAPLVSRGCPPRVAQVAVFVFSGVLHEILVGVPTHNIIGEQIHCLHAASASYGAPHSRHRRRRVCGNDVPAAANVRDRHPHQGQRLGRDDDRQRHLLGQLRARRAASGGLAVLFRLAGQIWEREQTPAEGSPLVELDVFLSLIREKKGRISHVFLRQRKSIGRHGGWEDLLPPMHL